MRISISRRGVIVAASLAGIAVWAASSQAAPLSFKVALTGAQQVPPVQTTATGTADLTYDPAQSEADVVTAISSRFGS